jgi:superfamily II DNA or RNA helicase
MQRIGEAFGSGARDVLGVLCCGAGKCLGIGTPVIMADGTVKAVELIQPGDKVLTPYSTVATVRGVTSGIDEMFRVTPVKGDPYTVNSHHILSVQITGRVRGSNGTTCGGRQYAAGDIANVTVSEWLAASNNFRRLAKGWRPDLVTFPTPEKALDIPPYILGAWLGDGTLKKTELTNMDYEVILEWYSYAHSLGLKVRVASKEHTECCSYTMTNGEGSRKENIFESKLKALGLYRTKRAIPLEYKTASVENRLEILAGLIDTDGYLSKGYYDAVWKSEELANDVAFVARSLGLAASVSPCMKEAKNGKAGPQPYFRVSITGDIHRIPCRVERRKAGPRKQIKSVLHSGITVESIGLGEYFGFELEGECKLYMLGDFQVTHNSVVAAHTLEHAGAPAIFIAHRAELIGGESLALARSGVRHRIIGPPALSRECSRRHVEEGMFDHIDHKGRVVVASVDTLANLPESDPLWRAVRMVVTDECFPAGTMIDTPDGLKRIELIEVGDTVTAFDENTGGFEPRQVTGLFKNPMPSDLVAVGVPGGDVRCTLNHPFWTKRGWIEAEDLQVGDWVLHRFIWQQVYHVEWFNSDTWPESVYNFEVEGLHTYIADGFVVHNCHHVLRENKWGRCRERFTNAVSLGLSATPHRADGKGLGRHADGIYETIIEGPNARQIELLGFLTPHKIYAPPSDLDLSTVHVTASGDYSGKELAAATRKSHIVGDVVAHYLRFAAGKLGMTFTVDVEAAGVIAEAFRAQGVPAEVVTGNTPTDLRNSIFRRFRKGEILQLVSCEIAGEGFDLPDVAVLSLARATASFTLATQQIGRVKRTLAGKQVGLVIDHVGNVRRHCQAKWCDDQQEFYIAVGEREWTLNRAERRSSSSKTTELINTCPMCFMSWPRVHGRQCPYCAHEEPPKGRSRPEEVEGVLAELSAEALAGVLADIGRIDGPSPSRGSDVTSMAIDKNHRLRQEAQTELRDAMARWGGAAQLLQGLTRDQAQRAFWITFGIDVGTAQTLGRTEAENLRQKVVDGIGRFR